ncbi:MAG TPA: TraR/DksA C4-type zinc finger protein [Gemmataceae bacterium]
MTKKELERYREILLDLDAQLRERLQGLSNSARRPSGGEAAGGISNAPFHLSDLGSQQFEQERDQALLETEMAIRKEVLDALQRIEDGTFGKCEECGKPISKERLNAVPYARYCIEDAEKLQESPPRLF